MHYGDEAQLQSSRLTAVVYKHEVLGGTFKRNKNGLVSKRCVDYQITSIVDCHMFNPTVLGKILNDPYKHLAKHLDKEPTEEWIQVAFKDLDGWGKFNVETKIVSHKNPSLRLH